MNIVIAGAHRVGKTTVAKALAEALNGTAHNASASSIYERYKVNPGVYIPLDKRMEIQTEIVRTYLELFESVAPRYSSEVNIFDRTLFDHLAYVQTYLMDVLPEIEQRRLVQTYSNYVQDVMPRYQSQTTAVILIHPHKDLAFVEEAYKGRNDEQHIRLLDAHITSNVWHYAHCPVIQVPVDLPLDERTGYILTELKKGSL